MKRSEIPFDSLPSHALMPVLPLRDVVVYPHMVIPLFVGREKSIHALDLAMQQNKRIVLVAQRGAEVDDPRTSDLYAIGTLANILQLLRLPDGTVKVLVEAPTECASTGSPKPGPVSSPKYRRWKYCRKKERPKKCRG